LELLVGLNQLKSFVLACTLLISLLSLAQQDGAPSANQIVFRTTSLPKIYLRQPVHIELNAQGGVTPLRWRVTRGELPAGLSLSEDGVLAGTAVKAGASTFMVTVSDNNKPPQERSQEFTVRITAPLTVEWSRPPRVNGQRVEGAIKVTNDTEDDFDLTEVVMAVNEIGRATAIGYQRFTLKKETGGLEIPFSENLPFGSYQLNVDVVAEVAETNSIYRSRLVPADRVVVQQGP
jgi:putative Ig domain-containing protein